MIPILVLIGLFVFKNYYVDDLSEELAKRSYTTETSSKYKEYDLAGSHSIYEGTLLEFGATNCSACRKMEYVLKDLRKRYSDKIKISFINTTQKEGLILGRKFGLLVIPMQVLMNKQGEVVYKHFGYISTKDLSIQIENHVLNK